jgi:hypothetical protein
MHFRGSTDCGLSAQVTRAWCAILRPTSREPDKEGSRIFIITRRAYIDHNEVKHTDVFATVPS